MSDKSHHLQDKFEIEGLWWSPRSSRRKVFGRLHCAPDKISKLEVVDALVKPSRDSFMDIFGSGKDESVIFGCTSKDNTPITLDQCYCTKWGGHPEVHSAHVVVIGLHTKSLKNTRVSGSSLSFDNLEDWVGVNSFKGEMNPETGLIKVHQHDVAPVIITIPRRKLSINIEWQNHAESSHKAVQISYSNSLVISLNRPLKFETMRILSMDIHRLMMLLTGERNLVRTFGCTVGDSIEFRLHYDQIGSKQTDSRNRFGSMLFPMPVIRDKLEQTFRAWFPQADKLRYIFNVFFGELLSKSPFLESKFFHFAQCLEAFQRETGRDGKHYSKKKFRRLHKRLTASLPKRLSTNVRNDIERVLWQANDISFADRLKELFSRLEPETVAIVTDDSKLFVDAVRQTRNLFTHLSPQPRRNVFPQDRWYQAIECMKKLMFILLLKLLDFSEADIRARMYALTFCGDAYLFHKTESTQPNLLPFAAGSAS